MELEEDNRRYEPETRINFQNIGETALGVLLGLGVAVTIGVFAFPFIQRSFGVFSYLGLKRRQVENIAKEMDKRYKVLVRTMGSNGKGHRFFRGIYADKGMYPLYYRYEYFPDGSAEFQIYPLITELFSTSGDNGTTGKLIYPHS
jgi:hypothetical protein